VGLARTGQHSIGAWLRVREVIRIKDRSCADVGDVIELGYD